MKIFVTGGAGYIGSVTAARLLDDGHEVVVFDNLEKGHRTAVDPRARLVQGDLRHRDEIVAAMTEAKPDGVMHFAAYALVGESMEQPGLYFRNNVGGGIHLVEAMVAAGVKRIVFSSTCATYGEPERMPITESSPQRPTNPYGESKLMLEKILLWQQELSGLEPVFLRYFNACGALARLGEDHDPESHLIPVILQVALGRRERVTIFGDDYDTPDGTCIRDYVHVGDLAHAHALAIVGNATGAFNLGTGDGHSVQEIVRVARETTGHAIPADVVARRPGDPARLVADGSKAREFLGWEPRMSDIREIVASAWDWHRAHPDGYPD